MDLNLKKNPTKTKSQKFSFTEYARAFSGSADLGLDCSPNGPKKPRPFSDRSQSNPHHLGPSREQPGPRSARPEKARAGPRPTLRKN